MTPRGRRIRQVLVLFVLALLLVGAAAWHWQGPVIGWVGVRYLSRLAAQDAADGTLARRGRVVGDLHQRLLLPPPPDALVPALFNVATELTPRVAIGEMTLAWAGYLYTNWAQDLFMARADGTLLPDRDAIRARIAEQIEFFAIQKRPDVPGIRIGDLMGTDGDDVLTLEEIEAAYEEGRDLDLGREPMRR